MVCSGGDWGFWSWVWVGAWVSVGVYVVLGGREGLERGGGGGLLGVDERLVRKELKRDT